MVLGWVPQFGLYIMGILILGITFKKHLRQKSSYKNTAQSFLEAEHNAQYTRAVEIPSDLFIHVDFSKFPTVNHKLCQQKYQALIHYENLEMINLQTQTNLELKQMYGPQKLEAIGQYEKNYYCFMDSAIQYGKELYETGYINEARQTLELCLAYHCDVSKCYILLIQIYKMQSDHSALAALKPIVEKEMCHSPFLHKVLELL